ncbi:MAG: AAA family ATPase, partial [Bacteriovorax sp.]
MSRILKLEVEGSKFFTDPLKLELSKKLNCIMGGRGTGKTTLLWLLASGLDPLIENNKEVFGLLNSNLGQGKIKLSLQNIDGEVFEVEKVLGENPIVYRADRTLIDFDSFRESISVDFYKSSQIEDIGMNPEDRLALIDKHLSKTIKDCRKEESVIISQLNQNKSSLSSLLLQ